ncbi:MAG: amidohydrolase family protein [Oscillospiraceae bacterium]|nr:amidohydrolase family protein [Oscillospiraceae bacterium]
MYSLVLKNATVIDGTGKPSYVADIGIKDDKIACIGKIDQTENCVDVTGKVVTPGFIDPHSHADCSAFIYPDCNSYIRQGITTFVGGQCGDSNAPIHNWWMRKYWEYDMWDAIEPYVYNQNTIQPADRAIEGIYKKTGIVIDWRTFKEYNEKVERQGLGCNMITLIGHSQMRADVMGLDQRRPPNAKEMAKMKEYIDEAMDYGAWGISTGRDYPPSAYAEVDEIVELTNHALRYNGMYFTHWKRTGVRVGTPTKPNKLAGIVEALDIAKMTGAKLQISHISTGFDIYPVSPEMDTYAAKVTLDVFDDYVNNGVDAAFDVIPGTTGGIATSPYLAAKFMPWLRMSGSLENFIKNLTAYDYREELLARLERGEWYTLNPKVNPAWDEGLTIIKSENSSYVGMTVREIASRKGKTSLETVIALLVEDPRIMVYDPKKTEAEVKALLSHPKGSPCTDTYAFDLEGTYGRDMEIPEILPHPHTYCAFPKFILKFPQATLEDTIHKITGQVARFLGIDGRGEIKEGFYADLVVMDYENLKTNENYIEPRVYPEGIELVVVNGSVVVDETGCTGQRPGRILKHNR